MALPVVNGANLMCTMGLAPSTLVVMPKNRTMIGGQPAANISDMVPMANVMPFALCNSLANPITAAQTAAALGVLTPGTCIPTPAGTWVPGSPTVMVGGLPGLTNSCSLVCAYGGQVSITFGGVATTTMA